LDGERQTCRTSESELGRLIATAMKEESGADAAILNGGSIRNSLEKGTVTRGDILRVLPFENTLVMKQLTGKQLKQALENGVSGYPQQYGGFPQTSGITIKFDPSRKKFDPVTRIGERVVEAKINGNDIEDEKNYKIAFCKPNADGGDGFVMVGEAPELAEMDKVDMILIRHIGKYGFKDANTQKNVHNVEDLKKEAVN